MSLPRSGLFLAQNHSQGCSIFIYITYIKKFKNQINKIKIPPKQQQQQQKQNSNNNNNNNTHTHTHARTHARTHAHIHKTAVEPLGFASNSAWAGVGEHEQHTATGSGPFC